MTPEESRRLAASALWSLPRAYLPLPADDERALLATVHIIMRETALAARKAALLEAADVIRSQKTAPYVRWADMAGVFGGPGAIDGWKGACDTGEHLLRERAEEEKP